MLNPREIYNLLLDASQVDHSVKEIVIGLTWTMCQSDAIGLAMSPGIPNRTLPWSGTLVNQPLTNLTPWLRSWDIYEATVGMAAVNAAINSQSTLICQATPITTNKSANLAVFDHFLPQIRGKKVVVIGRYPRLAQYEAEMEITVIERQPTGNDLPDPACEYYLPDADWVFLTATSIVNKTFPRLVELAQDAQLVLIGPTLPWLPELAQMGINYLAGVRVTNPDALRQTVAEGGGVRIFETGVQYCVLELIL
ncbi:MAG: hypothetical protein EA365_12670 [Gloeocapsa sp. DLM2.Bin57]|nr:MAG: hypothetical protein EA365_12670 [Gloeocapsa sp. DLM2.Bin57]